MDEEQRFQEELQIALALSLADSHLDTQLAEDVQTAQAAREASLRSQVKL